MTKFHHYIKSCKTTLKTEPRYWVYRTAFTNHRDNYIDLVVARGAKEADIVATQAARGVCDAHPCDEWAEVEILGEVATSPALADIDEFFDGLGTC
jgi:hypothetical protein